MAMNELDKIESQFITNHSMNGGASLEQNYVSNGSYKNSNSINFIGFPYYLAAITGYLSHLMLDKKI